VFLKEGSSMKSIGVHVYGGPINSASVIGVWGNPFEDYLSVMSAQIPPDGGLHYLPASRSTGVSLSGDPKDSKGRNASYIPLKHDGRYLSDQKSQTFGSFIDDVWNKYSTTESRIEWNNYLRSEEYHKKQEAQSASASEDQDKVVRFQSNDGIPKDQASGKKNVVKTVETHTTTTTTKTEVTDSGAGMQGSNGGYRRANDYPAQTERSRLVKDQKTMTQRSDQSSQNQIEKSDSSGSSKTAGQYATNSSQSAIHNSQSETNTGHYGTINNQIGTNAVDTNSLSSTTNLGGSDQSPKQAYKQPPPQHVSQNSSQAKDQIANQNGVVTSSHRGNQYSGGLDHDLERAGGSSKTQTTVTTATQITEHTGNQSIGSRNSSSGNPMNEGKQTQDMLSHSSLRTSSSTSSTICPGCGKSIDKCPSFGAIYADFTHPPSISGTGMSKSLSGETSVTTLHTASQMQKQRSNESSHEDASIGQSTQSGHSALGQSFHSGNTSQGQSIQSGCSQSIHSEDTSLGQSMQSGRSTLGQNFYLGNKSLGQSTSSGITSLSQESRSKVERLSARNGAFGPCLACGQNACPHSQIIFRDFQEGQYQRVGDSATEAFPHFWAGSLMPRDLLSR
jgi:hypothetical protein